MHLAVEARENRTTTHKEALKLWSRVIRRLCQLRFNSSSFNLHNIIREILPKINERLAIIFPFAKPTRRSAEKWEATRVQIVHRVIMCVRIMFDSVPISLNKTQTWLITLIQRELHNERTNKKKWMSRLIAFARKMFFHFEIYKLCKVQG